MQISLFDDACAQGKASTYSESWTITYHLVYSCVTAVHPRSLRVHGSIVIHFLPVVAPKFADASVGTGTQGTRQEAASDIHKTLFYPGTFVREDKRSIRNRTFMDQF